jgi:SAM-dependent methyltransferase
MDKRTFYRQTEVVATYDRQRFGGASGERVSRREIELALDMLPIDGRVVDLACGTGRVAEALRARGQAAVGVDFSPGMATRATAAGVPSAIADAFTTPFGDEAFDSAVSLRFAFHYQDLAPLLNEMRRVTRPGGLLVFDTYSWSPRAAVPLGSRAWGSKVHLHSRADVAQEAARARLRITRIEPCFLFSPYLYRLAPFRLEQAFERLERYVPSSWLCRTFWGLVRV